jgi:ABC-type multidrug transport system ATPase subunit
MDTALPPFPLDPIAEHAPVLMEVFGLTGSYGDQRALTDISFSVQPGEILGVIGPNGAGKTTMLETIAGLLPADEGRVLWRGTRLPVAHRRDFIFYLPDGLQPWRDQYVAHLLEFFATVYGRSKSDVAETVGAVDLAPVLEKPVMALSKGFSRRLMLALALLTPHPLLLMDEPFDGFDLRQTRDVMGLLRQVAASGRTLVLAIHQLVDAERICDRFMLLADGRLRGVGTLADLRARTALPAASLEDIFLALT